MTTIIANGQRIGPLDREAWLAARSQGIGASEAASACGVSPYETPLSLYLRKTRQAPPVVETEAMRLGTLMEPVLKILFGDATQSTFMADQLFLKSAEFPYLFATIDGVLDNGELVEFKTMGEWSANQLGDEGTDQVPDHWIMQAQQQMLVASTCPDPWFDASRVHFGVLVGGQRFLRFEVLRDEALHVSMVSRLAAFWGRVLRREPPPVSQPTDADLMHLLHPAADGSTIAADAALNAWAREFSSMGAGISALQSSRDLLKAKILEAMGDVRTAMLADGGKITRKVIHTEGGTYTRGPSDYTQIYLSKPKLKGGR